MEAANYLTRLGDRHTAKFRKGRTADGDKHRFTEHKGDIKWITLKKAAKSVWKCSARSM